MSRRILISDASSYKAVVLATYIQERYPSVAIETCDPRPLARLLHTRASDCHHRLRHRVNQADEYVQELAALARERRIDWLFPINSREVRLLLRQREALGQVLAYCGDHQAFELLDRKDRLQALAAECGLLAPRAYPDLASTALPAVAKPAAGSSAAGVRYLFSERDRQRCAAAAGRTRDYVFQQYVRGVGVGYSVFAREGAILAGYGHRRLGEFPPSGGSSVYREGYEDRRMVAAAQALLERTRWSGFAMFEFKLTTEGELYLIEVNPRIWGSLRQGLCNGANYLEPLLGPAEVEQRPGPPVRTYLPGLVHAALLLAALHGRPAPLWDFWRHWRVNRGDISLTRDPLGWLGALVRV